MGPITESSVGRCCLDRVQDIDSDVCDGWPKQRALFLKRRVDDGDAKAADEMEGNEAGYSLRYEMEALPPLLH
eukprot:CAMPEP_0174358946 /NCGR_PEP_ID=MMETSP0811_2-20130205/45516_1 /TAXON_ID=73025 ORGANISM="Eutreptiella gymnastica-like, Strain CCMP1594" /NCGR_SAMPLE_ID=MMETSP0811_2 /ASSEMBLY_ACC=CAM_ASM_000667 /LENGTH=72 /DNA_ID=CAMNT_0015493147 /DNA_START=1302 /DNA_END=1520 /DNA_ORIENTATION=-